MIEKRSGYNQSQSSVFYGWVATAFLLFLLVAGCGYIYYFARCIDGCGPYHNTGSAADLDGDGDLDVVLSNLRHEGETIIWAGPTLWINQGGGQFAPQRVNSGGPFATTGDVDGDGRVDLVQLVNNGIELHLNYGEQVGERGDFGYSYGIRSPDTGFKPGYEGTVLLGDLNNDGRLDAFVGGCCSVLTEEDGKQTYFPSTAWVWINLLEEGTQTISQGQAGQSLSALGDLPMRPALGDLDGDGDLDVFAAIQPPKKGGSYASADRVLLNDGSGNFSDSGQRLAAAGQLGLYRGGISASLRELLRQWTDGAPADQAGSTAVALGDLDGDGDLDALVGKTAGAVVWINQGGVQGGEEGSFALSGGRIPGGPTETVLLADLNGDSLPEALVAGTNQVAVWLNDGQAGFRDSGQRLGYTERDGLAIADFNGDGYPDVFSSAYNFGFHLWLNQGDGRLQEGN